MTKNFSVLAIDIGSSSTRAALFDSLARPFPGTGSAVRYNITYSSDGGAELSPNKLLAAARSCLKHAQAHVPRSAPVRAVCASAFWHGLLGLDRDWKPLTPIYTWADARAAAAARGLRQQLSERAIHARTGCMLHSSFWPAKLWWLRQSNPRLFTRVSRWVSPADWIFHKFFATEISSPSMASATGLYNLRTGDWDPALCQVCEVDRAQLPGLDATDSKKSPFIIVAPIGDGAASNLGSGADDLNTVAINVGTSAAVRMIRARRGDVPPGLFEYVVDGKRRVVGGAVSNAGNLREWGFTVLRLRDDRPTNRLVFNRELAAGDCLTALPFWSGERAPTWPDRQLGLLDGLTQATRPADIMRVLTTAVFYRLGDILDLLPVRESKQLRIIVSGGILRSPPAVRLLADAIGHDVEMARQKEASLRGAAVYALQQLGIKVPRPARGICVRYDRRLSARHRFRREQQRELETILVRRESL